MKWYCREVDAGHARSICSRSRGAGEPTPAASQRDLPPARRSELGFFTKLNSGHPSRRTGTCGWTSSCGEAVLGTLRTENTGRSPSCWRSPRQTHKRRYTCKEAMPTTMDQPPLLRGVQAPTLWSSGTRVLRRREPQTFHHGGGGKF